MRRGEGRRVGNGHVPSGGFGEGGGLDQRGFDPGLRQLALRHASHVEEGLCRNLTRGTSDK